MSRAPVLHNDAMVRVLADLARARSAAARLRVLARLRPRHLKPVIGLVRGLTDPISGLNMGQTAEGLASRFGISRERMDGFALESHRRLARAQDGGRLEELAPLFGGDGTLYERDEGLRRDADLPGLARLKPAFEPPHGLVTAGNSAQITDGAACLLLASADAVRRYALPVLGRLEDCQWAGLEPSQMGLGPVHAMAPILARRGLGSADVDYWEINEAFATQVLACTEAWQSGEYCRQELGLERPFPPIPPERLNVDGGAVALGHPVGCSGARIVLHLLHVLKRNGARTGMASLCIGGGQGGAMLIRSLAGLEDQGHA
jgi:acetyl-CoA C-acetyltransferase